jgi:hypothetical protein
MKRPPGAQAILARHRRAVHIVDCNALVTRLMSALRKKQITRDQLNVRFTPGSGHQTRALTVTMFLQVYR